MIPAVQILFWGKKFEKLESSGNTSFKRWHKVTVNNHDHLLNTYHVPIPLPHTCIRNFTTCLPEIGIYILFWDNLFYSQFLLNDQVRTKEILFPPFLCGTADCTWSKASSQPVSFMAQLGKMRWANQIALLGMWNKSSRGELPIDGGGGWELSQYVL